MTKGTKITAAQRKPRGQPPLEWELRERAAGLIAASEGPDDELLRRHQVAAWLGLTESGVHALTQRCLKSSGKRHVLRYRRGDVLAMLRALAAEYELLLKNELAAARGKTVELERQWRRCISQSRRGGGREARAA